MRILRSRYERSKSMVFGKVYVIIVSGFDASPRYYPGTSSPCIIHIINIDMRFVISLKLIRYKEI